MSYQADHHSATPSSTQGSSSNATKRKGVKRFFVPLGIMSLGVAILLVLVSLAPKPQKTPVITKAPMVEVIEVNRGDVVFSIETQGSVAPRTETTLISEVAGVIKNVSAKFVVGGYFKQGELMLEIDPINYEVAVLQAQARLEGAEAKLVEEKARGAQAAKEWDLTGRNKSNAPILALRKPQLQQAEADVKAAQADLRSAQIKLQRTKIVAPYDAMLKAKMVDIGQYVSTGSQLATSFAVDYAEVRLPIKEHDLGYVDVPALGTTNQRGARVVLSSFVAGSMQTWPSFITRSEGVIDERSRVNYLVAQINDPYGLLSNADASTKKTLMPVGTFIKAKVLGRVIPNVITIPRKAMRGDNLLYLVSEDRKLKIVEVELLRSDAENIFITNGVEVGDRVVLTKLSNALNGMTVRLVGDPENNSSEVDEVNRVATSTDEATQDKSTVGTSSVSAKEKEL